MDAQLHTVHELVSALGGASKAAERLGEKYPSTVSNWLRIGRIPAGKFLKHSGVLADMGISAAPSIWFGQVSEVAE